jgi:hypothetical protein
LRRNLAGSNFRSAKEAPTLGGRDLRAIVFFLLSTALVLTVASMVFHNWIVTAALVAAYESWLLTRARMIRVMRRLRGKSVERSSYFRN